MSVFWLNDEQDGNELNVTCRWMSGNAGLRVYDIKDPLLPVESGWFIPPQPSERAGPLPRDLVTQTEDVLVDTRGYIYVTDKQWGLWIVRYTGPDQPAPTDR